MRVGVAIAFPLIILLAWCGLLEWRILSGREVRLAIEGYDPRDLLSGHYLTFRFSFASQINCQAAGGSDGPRCVCLTPVSGRASQYEGSGDHACDQVPSYCHAVIQGTCQGSRFITGLERYYIPEELAPVLGTVPSEASASVSLSREGLGVVTGVYVKDERIEEYARSLLLSRQK